MSTAIIRYRWDWITIRENRSVSPTYHFKLIRHKFFFIRIHVLSTRMYTMYIHELWSAPLKKLELYAHILSKELPTLLTKNSGLVIA